MSELYKDFIDRKADQIITDLGGTITPAPANAELYRDFLGRKFDDVITAITNMSTGGVLSGDTAPNNADGDNNDLYVQYDSSYNVVALYVKLNDIWRSISTTGSIHTYSTTEQVVGTWIDGSPLYEKTFVNNSLVLGNNEVGDFNDIDVSFVWVENAFVVGKGASVPNMYFTDNDVDHVKIYVRQTDNTIRCISSLFYVDCACYVVIRYTKTQI